MKNYEDMTPEERKEFMEAMTEADRRHEMWRTEGRPLTLKQSLLEYENTHRILYW